MEAIHDQGGIVVGWRHRTAVYDTAGKPRAFISRHALFTYDGTYIGSFEDGWYRDPQGHCIGFEVGASGGPMKPLPKAAVAPLPNADPPPPKVEPSSPPRIRSSKWSPSSWGELIAPDLRAPTS